MMDTLTDPQIWLILVTLGHTLPGVILATNWANDTAKMVAGWMLQHPLPWFMLLFVWMVRNRHDYLLFWLDQFGFGLWYVYPKGWSIPWARNPSQ